MKPEMQAVLADTKSPEDAAAAMQSVGVHACTDVTGFGLLGHADAADRPLADLPRKFQRRESLVRRLPGHRVVRELDRGLGQQCRGRGALERRECVQARITHGLLHEDAGRHEPGHRRGGRGVEKGSGYQRQRPAKWQEMIPLRIRAMVLAGERLFTAGLPDVIDFTNVSSGL